MVDFTARLRMLYWFGPLFALASFTVTHGPDGELTLFISFFSALATIYCTAMPLCFHQRSTIHSLGHACTFAVLSVLVYPLNPPLVEMAASLYYLIPLAVLATVAMGALTLFLVTSRRQRCAPRC